MILDGIKDILSKINLDFLSNMNLDFINNFINNDMIMLCLIVLATYLGFKFVNTILKFVAYALVILYFASKLGIF